MSQDYANQPIEFISTTSTMNAYDDATALGEKEVALIQNFVKRKGIFEIRAGRAALNSTAGQPLAGGACYGLSTFDPLDSTTMQYVAISGGVVYAGSTFPLTSMLTGLTTSTLMKLSPFNGRMLINDSAQGMAWCDGTSAGWCGIPSPKETVLIDDFESVTGWSTTNGTCAVDDSFVLHGRHGLKFKASAGATYSPRKTITSLSLSTFLAAPRGDGATSTNKDYIRVQITRSFKTDFTTCDLVLQSSAGNWSYARLSDFAEWNNNDGAGLTFDIYVRIGAFQAGAGTLNWAAITSVGFDIVAATGKQPFIIADWLRMERGGMVVSEFGRTIANFESDETWTATAGSISYSYTYKTHLARSLILVGSGASAYRDYATVLDLTTFANGAAADSVDAIEIRVARDTSKLTGTLTLAFRDNAGSPVTASYIINSTSIYTPRIGGTAVAKLADPALVFQTFTIRKDQFTNGGTVTWSGINRCTLTASATAGSFYVDGIKLVKHRDRKDVVLFEPSELLGTPTVTSITVSGSSKYGWSDPNIDPVLSDEGSSTSYYVKIPARATCTIDILFPSDLDLSAFASGAATQDGDKLGPKIWVSKSANIEEIAFYYDTNNGTFSDYFVKQLLKGAGQIPATASGWIDCRFERREHEQIPATGATGTWATIDKVRLSITAGKGIGGVTVYLDQWILQRGANLSGIYWYGVTYRNARGARSEFSNISNRVEVKSSNVMVQDIPTSTGCTREIWRLGGLTPIWKLCGILGDDETTIFEDILSEESLGEELPPLYEAPPIAKTFCIHDNLVIRGNLTDLSGGYRHKTSVAVGEEESIDEVDPKKIFDVGKEDGYELVSLLSAKDRVFAFKEKGIWSFDPYNLNQRPIQHSKELGIISEQGFATDDKDDIYFITVDRRLFVYNGARFDDQFSWGIRSYLDAIPASYVGKVVGAFYDGFVLFAIPTTGDTANSLVLCWDTIKGVWSVFSGWPTSIFHVKNYTEGYGLISGTENANGYLYTNFSGDTDGGSVIVGVITSAARALDPTLRDQPASIYLNSKKMTATNAGIKIEPYFDLTDSANDLDYTISDATHQRDRDGIPSGTYWPVFLQLKLTTSLARVAIRTLAFGRREESRQ